MRPEAFESVEVLSEGSALPMRSSQSSPWSSSLFHLALMTGLAGSVVLPQLTLALQAMTVTETRNLILSNPLFATELALAIGFWIALFAWPLKRLAVRVNWRRELEITPESVAVKDHKAFSQNAWNAPLNSYLGIAYHVRTSLSGIRHELILMHPQKHRSVLLMVSEHISAADIARFSALLQLPEVSAKDLYALPRLRQALPQNAGFLAAAA